MRKMRKCENGVPEIVVLGARKECEECEECGVVQAMQFVPQERIREQIGEQLVIFHVSQFKENVVEVVQIVSQAPMMVRINEQIVGCAVDVVEHNVDVSNAAVRGRHRRGKSPTTNRRPNCGCACSPNIRKDTFEVIQLLPPEHHTARTVERLVDFPVPKFRKEIVVTLPRSAGTNF